jgi:hypothetical protein
VRQQHFPRRAVLRLAREHLLPLCLEDFRRVEEKLTPFLVDAPRVEARIARRLVDGRLGGEECDVVVARKELGLLSCQIPPCGPELPGPQKEDPGDDHLLPVAQACWNERERIVDCEASGGLQHMCRGEFVAGIGDQRVKAQAVCFFGFVAEKQRERLVGHGPGFVRRRVVGLQQPAPCFFVLALLQMAIANIGLDAEDDLFRCAGRKILQHFVQKLECGARLSVADEIAVAVDLRIERRFQRIGRRPVRDLKHLAQHRSALQDAGLDHLRDRVGGRRSPCQRADDDDVPADLGAGKIDVDGEFFSDGLGETTRIGLVEIRCAGQFPRCPPILTPRSVKSWPALALMSMSRTPSMYSRVTSRPASTSSLKRPDASTADFAA